MRVHVILRCLHGDLLFIIIMPNNDHLLIQRIIRYWRLCIEREDRLSQDLLSNATLKSVVSPLGYDPFIFPPHMNSSIPFNQEGNLNKLLSKISATGKELMYGYPLVYFRDNKERERIAPLLVIHLTFIKDDDTRYIVPDEPSVEIGISAANKLGFRNEELKILTEVIKDNLTNSSLDETSRVNAVLDAFNSHVTLSVIEPIDPSNVNTHSSFGIHTNPGLYNMAVFFEGENTFFNQALIQELIKLDQEPNYSQTALPAVIGQSESAEITAEKVSPILGFHADEYQIAAIQQALSNSLTVITGPPGTGKSQLIINLLLTLFVHNKTALLVSHTNEAVNVVQEKIMEKYGFLLTRTGSKPHRQALKPSLDSFISTIRSYTESNKELSEQLDSIWLKVQEYQKQLIDIDILSQRVEQAYNEYRRKASLLGEKELIDRTVHAVCWKQESIEQKFGEIESYSSAIKKRIKTTNQFFSLPIVYLQYKKLTKKVNKFLDLFPEEFITLPSVKRHIDDHRIGALLPTFRKLMSSVSLYNEFRKIYEEIRLFEDTEWIKQEITKLLADYRNLSQTYIKTYLTNHYHNNKSYFGDLFSVLQSISTFSNNSINANKFNSAQKLLPLWSCTLKSLKASFPLLPGLFDYVIFDEASQIDLPSAAPALFRGKKAIVVGDPMQLTHISSLSDQTEKTIAQQVGISEMYALYPGRIGYKKMNLYKASEAALRNRPIFLANHYRSHLEIISLCNQIFYRGDLKIITRLDESSWPHSLETGIHWKVCTGVSRLHPYGSRFNKEECDSVIELLKSLILQLKNTQFTIGVVTPFSFQRDMITRAVTNTIEQSIIDQHVLKIQTVHQYQGSEKDIMIFSPVVAAAGNGNSDNWFNSYKQLLNVALSRARRLLYIIGDFEYFKSRQGILHEIAEAYESIKNQKNIEAMLSEGKIDTEHEKILYSKLLSSSLIKSRGYEVGLKTCVGPYILDISLVGPKKIDIECDGSQHEIIDGIPVIKDIRRDGYLRDQGWEIIRIKNYRITLSIDGVIKQIEHALDY